MNSKKHLGHTARKRFGQNFLHDTSVIQGIVAAIYPQPNQFLVEIGPGLGALTEPVGELVDHLTVVELDRDLADVYVIIHFYIKSSPLLKRMRCNLILVSFIQKRI